MNNIYDLIIIGSGPGGLSAGIHSGRAKLKTLIIEKKTFGVGVDSNITRASIKSIISAINRLYKM